MQNIPYILNICWHKWLVLNKGKEFQSKKTFPVLPTLVVDPCCIRLECYAEDPNRGYLTEYQKWITFVVVEILCISNHYCSILA